MSCQEFSFNIVYFTLGLKSFIEQSLNEFSFLALKFGSFEYVICSCLAPSNFKFACNVFPFLYWVVTWTSFADIGVWEIIIPFPLPLLMEEPVSVLFWIQRVSLTSPAPLLLFFNHLPVKSEFSTIEEPDELDVDTIPPELLLELDDELLEEDELEIWSVPKLPELPEEEEELENWSVPKLPEDEEEDVEGIQFGKFEQVFGLNSQQPNIQQLLPQAWKLHTSLGGGEPDDELEDEELLLEPDDELLDDELDELLTQVKSPTSAT